MLAKLPRASLQILPILLKILWSKGQEVVDEKTQDHDIINEYCPRTENCAEGSHVMCMYYNKNRPYGPTCTNYQAIEIKDPMKTKIVQILNAIRSKLALGMETAGRGGLVSLPRAYGMLRLSWDDELALFAKVLANQCVLKHDLCRATKRFHSPGQTVGFLRFTIPNWDLRPSSSLIKKYPNLDSGFNEQKVWIAMKTVLWSWYKDKIKLTRKMVESYPDFNAPNTPKHGKSYMALAVASATHVGCGMAGFGDILHKHFENSAMDIQHNAIELVCNFSERPESGRPIYRTTPPNETGYSPRCGCPEDTTEDEDCLCNLGVTRLQDSEEGIRPCSTDPEQNCEQTVVLLPIFKMENAPDDKLISKNVLRFINNRKEKSKRNHFDLSTISKDKKKMIPKQHHNHSTKHVTNRKSSIFTKVETFKLPHKKTDVIKKDVGPRKDFSNVEQLVNAYLSKRKDGSTNIDSDKNLIEGNLDEAFESLNDITTETFLNNVEEKVMSYENNFKERPNNLTDNVNFNEGISKKNNEDDENKFLTLLDTLEREVKHIELVGNQKEIFDAKIRKLYGTVLGKSPILLSQNQNTVHDSPSHSEYGSNTDYFEPRHLPDHDRIKHGYKHVIDRPIDHNYFNDENNVKLPYDRKNNMHRYNDVQDIHNRVLRSRHDNKRDRDYSDYRLDSEEDFNNRYNDFAKAKYHDDVRADYEDDGEEFDHKGLDRSNYVRTNENQEDTLGYERKLYQEKIENLERKLREARSNIQNSENMVRPPLQMRHLRPTRDQTSKEPTASKLQVDKLYVPDRARYLHGF